MVSTSQKSVTASKTQRTTDVKTTAETRSGWYGDVQGHRLAALRGHGYDEESAQQRANIIQNTSKTVKKTATASKGGSTTGKSAKGQGWHGDSARHAAAGAQSHKNDTKRKLALGQAGTHS